LVNGDGRVGEATFIRSVRQTRSRLMNRVEWRRRNWLMNKRVGRWVNQRMSIGRRSWLMKNREQRLGTRVGSSAEAGLVNEQASLEVGESRDVHWVAAMVLVNEQSGTVNVSGCGPGKRNWLTNKWVWRRVNQPMYVGSTGRVG
jgi:hypothetical protein